MDENGGWLGSLMNGGMGGIQELLKTIRSQQEALTKKNSFDPNTFNANDFLGGSFGFAQNEWQKLYKEGNPAIKEAEQLALKRLGIQSRSAKAGIEEKGAQSGFRGANANLYNALFESEANATEDITTQSALQQSQFKLQALGGVTDLAKTESGMKLDVAKMNENVRQYEKTFQENVRQFGLEYALRKRELDLKEEEASGSFGGFLGDIFGTALGFATGGAGSWLGDKAGGWLDGLFS